MKYNFYFDETFHDKKITIKNDNLNVLRDDGFEDYIGVFCGIEQKELHNFIDEYTSFESSYRTQFGLDENAELKSTVVGQKHYKYGLKSFNKLDYKFYYDFFNLCNKYELIFQIDVINKVELFITNLIENTFLTVPIPFDEKAFIYSITKFLIVYGNKKLFNSLYEIKDAKSAEVFKYELLYTLQVVIDNISGIERKKKEYQAFKELLIIIEDIDFSEYKYDELKYKYEYAFNGLILLLDELHIKHKEVKLIIDNENSTFLAAKNIPFGKIKQADSKNVIQLRFVDILCGFIGRLMSALVNDEDRREDDFSNIEDIKDNDLNSKRLISPLWFEIDEKTFSFYKLLYDALIIRHEHYWTTITMFYPDDVIMFYGLIRYFASYKDYETFKNIDLNMHTEYYNSCVCQELSEYYTKI